MDLLAASTVRRGRERGKAYTNWPGFALVKPPWNHFFLVYAFKMGGETFTSILDISLSHVIGPVHSYA